jgi:hypothetical protein
MGIMVDRRATGIHFHHIRVIGGKQFLLVGKRVIKIHTFFLLKIKNPPAPKAQEAGCSLAVPLSFIT